MAHGGFAVARHEGRVVFVADALPGERVIAEITDDSKRSFWRAVAVDVLEASADRVPHIWPAASIDRNPTERAGGADYGFIRPERQRALKAEVIRDALTRFAGLPMSAAGAELSSVAVQAIEPGLGWRTRLRLHVDEAGVVGPRAARSHRVIAIDEHPLAAAALQERAPWRERHPGADRIELVATSEGQSYLSALAPGESAPATPILERSSGREFQLSQSGFWQVHSRAAETLQAAVGRALDPARLDISAEQLDLYGGVGLFAATILDAVGAKGRLVSVESDQCATEFAAANLSDWLGARAQTAKVERFLSSYRVQPGASIVLDPPRSGAGREVVERLTASQASQIVYVACDPVAFARDLGYFRAAGWDAETLEAFDLFPHTHHVELVARICPAL